MRILVTGASGFVGKNLIPTLSREGYTIYILSMKKSYDSNLFIGDLGNKDVLFEATKNMDIVIHLAGITKGDVFNVNTEGTKNLVDSCIKNKIKKFIFISSYDVIINVKYGKSKAKAEDHIINSGLNYLIFRPTVIYGKNNNKDLDKLIELIKKYPIIPIPGNGEFKLQPILVDDLVNLIIKAVKSKIKNKIYFVAGPKPITFNQIVDIISKKFSKRVYRINIPKFIIYLKNKNLLNDKVCSIDKVKKDFNFNPVTFEVGINKIL